MAKIIAHLSSHALNLFVMVGNARFSGFNIDMWEEIARRLNLTNFEFVKVDEGPTKISDGVFAGIIGGLQKLVSFLNYCTYVEELFVVNIRKLHNSVNTSAKKPNAWLL